MGEGCGDIGEGRGRGEGVSAYCPCMQAQNLIVYHTTQDVDKQDANTQDTGTQDVAKSTMSCLLSWCTNNTGNIYWQVLKNSNSYKLTYKTHKHMSTPSTCEHPIHT